MSTLLTHLPHEVWIELTTFFSTTELFNLVRVQNRALLARLCAPGCIQMLDISTESCKLGHLAACCFTLGSLKRLERLNFKFEQTYGPTPHPFIFTLLEQASRTQGKHLRHLSLGGYVNARKEGPEKRLFVGELFPFLDTLDVTVLLTPQHLTPEKDFLSILPATLTSLSAPFEFDAISSLPSSMTELDLFFNESADVHRVLRATSTFQSLAILRLRAVLPSASVDLPQDASSSPLDKRYSFLKLEEFTFSQSDCENPIEFLDAPRLHSHASSIFAPTTLLPSSLTRLKMSLSRRDKVDAKFMQSLPTGLKILHIVGPDLKRAVDTSSWFGMLPPGLEELIVPSSMINWNRLPPRLERLLCSNSTPGVLFVPFAQLASRHMSGQAPPTTLSTPLPSHLIELHSLSPLGPFNMLSASLRSLSMNLQEPMALKDVEQLISFCPSLQSLRLDSLPFELPSPREDGTTAFDIVRYPPRVIEDQHPTLHRSGFRFLWTIPQQGFQLPSTLNTLILRSTADWNSAYQEIKLPPEALDSLLQENLARLPSLTHLEIHPQHYTELKDYFPSLPLLEVLINKKKVTPPSAFALLPRNLKFLHLKLENNTIPSKLSLQRPLLGNDIRIKRTAAASSASAGSGAVHQRSANTKRPPPDMYDILFLPSTLTDINFGSKYKFSNSTIGEWPMTLRALRFAPDASWCDADAITLKASLPSLRKLRLRGPVVASPTICFGARALQASSSELSTPQSATSEGPSTDMQWPNISRVTKELLIKLSSEALLLHDIGVDSIYVDITSFGSFPPSVTFVDLEGAERLRPLELPRDTLPLPVWSSSITHLDLPVVKCDCRIKFDKRATTTIEERINFPILVFPLPLNLTALSMLVDHGPQGDEVFEALPRTLKHLSFRAPPEARTWQASARALSLLPASLETLCLNYMTFEPTHLDFLPTGLQQLTFRGSDLWTMTEVVAVALKLSVNYKTAPSAVFTDADLVGFLVRLTDSEVVPQGQVSLRSNKSSLSHGFFGLIFVECIPPPTQYALAQGRFLFP